MGFYIAVWIAVAVELAILGWMWWLEYKHGKGKP